MNRIMMMKPKIILLLALAAVPLAASAASVSDLAWLSGCWAAVNQEAGSGEQWMSPAGGTMFGVNRTIRDSKTVAFEYMRIVEQDDDSLVFVASPSGQNTASFLMSSINDREVIFENPDHDFPQRIIYRLASANDLTGRIEGIIDGSERAIDFPMKRIVCESGRPDL